jgi:hypothetical protein
MDITKTGKTIRQLHQSFEKEAIERKIDLCFDLMADYSKIAKAFRSEDDEKNCCYAATILSGVVDKATYERVKKFLDDSKCSIPNRARQILQANLLRMRGF